MFVNFPVSFYPLTQVEQDIPTKRSRIDCQSESDLITSTPQTRGLSNKSGSRGCRKHPAKSTASSEQTIL